jgi:hypothetical protein
LATHHQHAAILKQRGGVTPPSLRQPNDPCIAIRTGTKMKCLADDFLAILYPPDYISVILSLSCGRGRTPIDQDYSMVGGHPDSAYNQGLHAHQLL